MSRLKTALKEAVEVGLGSVLGSARHRRNRGRGLILAFHNVLPEGVPARGDRSLHLGIARFRAFLDVVEDLCTVTPLADIVESNAERKPPVALTFDDAYAGFLEAALPELTRRGHPCTVFVCPGLLGTRAFWWDSLAGQGGLDPRLRAAAMNELGGNGGAIVSWAASHGIEPKPLPASYRAATEAALSEAVEKHDCSLGVHTWDHPRLDSLSEKEIRDQLSRTWSWLQERFPNRSIPWACYPYGHYDDRVVEISRDIGLVAGLRVDGGWIRDRDNRFELPRLTIPSGLSVAGFRLRVTGVVER